jgi:arylsulfatase A-like enzyme
MRKPNVLLITADQLRYDCVGFSGQYAIQTPNIDTLADQSLSFTHAYSHIPVCGPARQSLLCGRRPETFGALWNYNITLPVHALQPDAYTWTKSLANNGYSMAFLGKWGVHPTLDPKSFGYDSYVSEQDYADFQQSRYSQVKYTNGFFGENNPIPVEDSETHWFADQARAGLKRLQLEGKPWHMALHFSAPHLPNRPSGRFAALYDPSDIEEWSGFRETFSNKPFIQHQQLYSWGVEKYTWEDWAPIVARYYGVISQLDEAIGSVLQMLEELDAVEDTIVIFTADHGDMCGSHRMMDKHYILYDDVVRVPMIIRWPGRGRKGVCEQFVYNFLDLAPTLLEALDLMKECPGNLQGKSLVPLISGQMDGLTAWRDSIVASYNGQQFGLYNQRMIRTEQWKYIWNPTDIDELYDLNADPAELCNCINEQVFADTVKRLRRQLYEQLTKDEDALVGNEWMRNQLLNGAKLSSVCK